MHTDPRLIEQLLSPDLELLDAALDVEQAKHSSQLTLPELPSLTASQLDSTERQLLGDLQNRRDDREALLIRSVEQNSGSRNSAGVEAMLDLLAPRLVALGFSERRVALTHQQQGPYGPHAVFKTAGQGPHVLLSGHVDTVFEPGCGFERVTRDGALLRGPGCADMKGGLVTMIGALEGLHAQGVLAGRAVSVVLNGDEEISSSASCALLEAVASRASLGLVFEPGRRKPMGAVTLARKGVGSFILTVHGHPAHSGNNFLDGCNAVDAIARQVLAIGRLSDLGRGCTLNVGTLKTGPSAKRNRVPDWAQAEIDLRVDSMDDAQQIIAKVKQIAETTIGVNPWTGQEIRSELEVGPLRPPMPCRADRVQLYGQVEALATLLEQPFGAVAVGGGSDANILAAAGLPVLDGLGPVGGGLHTTDEWVDLDSMNQRTALTALLLHRFFDGRLDPGAARAETLINHPDR